jgi:hypothetical protein
MSLENPNRIESSVSKNTTQRRTFLKRATAGAVIASIPGRSAWAGIAGSIVASGHGSDFNQGACTTLLGPDGFDTGNTTNFSSIFGGNPFRANGSVRNSDRTFGEILTVANGTFGDLNANQIQHHLGLNGVNVGLVVIYLNAIYHLNNGIYYPVLSQHNNDPVAFASYLYNEALNNSGEVGTLLNDTIAAYSNGGGCV